MPEIRNSHLTAAIAARGAELQSLRDKGGDEWLWHGDPAWWPRRAPLLFPVVGRSPDDHLTIGGVSYPMDVHGFARDLDFEVVETGEAHVLLALDDSEATRAVFPFAFRLEVNYRLDGSTLTTTVTVRNCDTAPMPFQFGFHPAFVWPLPKSASRTHRVELENRAEPLLFRLDPEKAIKPTPLPSPFAKGALVPDPAMFEDAMLFPEGAGTRMAFVAQGGARVDLDCENLPNFAVWQKAGAPFLCLEPWHGTPPFAGTGAALETRNGRAILPPGGVARFGLGITISPG